MPPEERPGGGADVPGGGSAFWSEQDGMEEAMPPAEPPAEGDKSIVIESLLFVAPSPVSVAGLSELTGIESGAVREIVNRLAERYEDSGLVLREVAGGFGFYAAPEAAPYIARLIRSQVNPRLTRAALETMAIVAYLQPVSRGVVAEIRGVQSEGVMKTLEERGLVQVVGRGGPPGYPQLFGTTGRFLERFGLRSLEDLPRLEEFAPDDETVEKIQRSLSWELMEEVGLAGGGEGGEGPEGAGGGGGSVAEGV